MIITAIKKIIFKNRDENEAMQQLRAVKLTKHDIAIDCGANIGKITYILCKSGATVYAFEPNPHAFSVLQNKFSKFNNVICVEKGVGDNSCKIPLYFHENSWQDEIYWSTGSSLLSFKNNVLDDKFVYVDIVDLSNFIVSLNHRVKLLKLDVEGVECKILNKLIATGVINRIDNVFVETHDHKIPELREETDALRELIQKNGIKNINLEWQ